MWLQMVLAADKIFYRPILQERVKYERPHFQILRLKDKCAVLG